MTNDEEQMTKIERMTRPCDQSHGVTFVISPPFVICHSSFCL